MKTCTQIPLSSLRRDTPLRKLTLTVLLSGMLFNTGPIQANPTGGVVVHGDVSFQNAGTGSLQINQSSNQAIINWADFSIAPGELTRFIQPGADASVLNRVTGGDPSSILGALQGNGNVFVINPNGILVGAGGSIDVHGLVLSTLDIENGEFLAGGDLVFKGNGNNGVTNLGRINAIGGDVFLIGKTITNSGSITATNGTVGLAAGEEVLLKANTGAVGERVFVRATGSGASGTGILNDGTIEGAAVELKAHGNIYAMAINNKGSVRAVGASHSGGRVFLNGVGGSVSNSGSIRASSPGAGNSAQILIQAAYAKVDGMIRAEGGSVAVQTTDLAEVGADLDVSSLVGNGGRVTIEGAEVSLSSAARIDASGSGDGGIIQIGGGLQGRDANLLNADLTTVDAGSALIADSTDGGRGGSVVIWSDGDTLFSGDISAKGSGGGGFAEISGRENLSIDGSSIDLGQGGFLLLDPSNFTVTDTVRNTIRPTLNAGTDVVIFTNGSDTAAGNGDIIFSSDFSGINAIDGDLGSPTTGSLSLLAYGDIFMRRDLVNNGTGNVNLVAGWDGVTPASFGPSGSGSNVSGTPAILMDSQIFADTSTYGNRNGSVYIGLETDKVTPTNVSTISIASRNGETNVAAYDLVMVGDNTAASTTGDNRWVQLGYRPADVDLATLGREAATGRIKVNVLNDITMTAGVKTNATGSASAAPGQYNFVQIGHGGRDAADNGYNHSGGIVVQAGLGSTAGITGNIIGTAGANLGNFIHIGHGGHGGGVNAGSFSGAITVEAGSAGRVEMTAGTGRRAFTQIGHGGFDVDAGTAVTDSVGYHSGAITVRAGTDIIFSAGTGQSQIVTDGYAYSMIGHGGGVSGAVGDIQGHNGTITVEAGSGNVSGAIRFKAGDLDDNFAQLGHGGRGSTSGTGADGHWGDILVDAIGDITFTAGTGQAFRTTQDGRMYAQLGHGGYDSGANVNILQTPGTGLGHHGLIQVISRNGDILFSGGDTALGSAGEGFGRIHYAQLGHGGYSTEGDHFGSITVTATNGSIRFTGGATSDDATDGIRNSAQLGHGGYLARGDQGRATDTIAVTAGQDIEFLAGGGTQTSGTLRSYAQLGNGGYDADNPNAIVTADPGNQGDIRVVSTGGNITFTGGPGGDGYSVIGHGGLNTNGDNSGNISVNALGGAITFTGGSANDTYAQIGHGGRVARGDHSGSIELNALGNITFTGGEAARAYAMIGHGGHDSDNPNPAYYPDNDPATVDRGPTAAERVGNNGNIAVTSSAGDVRFTTGSGSETFVQIGHGGAFTDGDSSGNINVSAANIIFDASNPSGSNQYAQLGHGGYLASGGRTGAITVNATGEIAFTSGTNGSYTQIGHGGYNDHRVVRGGATGNFVQNNANDRYYPGTHSGAIIVNAGSDIRFLAGTGTGSYGQIGHGGFRNAAEAGEGHSGNISVVGGGAISFIAQSGAQAYLQIGHGGYEAFGNHGYAVVRAEGGSVTATQAGSGFLANGALAPGSVRITVDPTGIGAGTSVFTDDGAGNLIDGSSVPVGTVDYATGEVTFNNDVNAGGGAVEVAYLHGGSNILVDGGSGVAFVAGAGSNSHAQIGHGGASSSFASNLNIQPEEPAPASYTSTTTYHLNTPTGTPLGTSGNITVFSGTGTTTNANAAVTFAAGGGNDAYAQIGNGGRAARGDHRGDVAITASGNISFTAVADGVATATTTNNGTINARLQNHTSGTFTLAQTGNLERGALVINYENPLAPFTGTIFGDEFGRLFDGGIQVGTVTTAGVVTLTETVSDSAAGGANSLVAFDHFNTGVRSYAQIGHGGHDADNPNATTPGDPGNLGNITVTSGEGAITFAAGNRNESYAQLGHGGYATNGDHSGNIVVEALGTNGAITFSGGSRNETYTQLGHGGRSAKGNFGLVDVDGDMIADGDITARTAGSIQFTAGSAGQTYAQLGHGGYDADTVTTRGNPSNRGSILVESATGDIIFNAAGSAGANSYVQLGHGGMITSGDFSGTITVLAGSGSVAFSGGEATDRYAQLGHGGRAARGDHEGAIEVIGATGVTFTGGGVAVVTAEKSADLNDAATGASATATLVNLANLDLSSIVITVADPLAPEFATITSDATGQLFDGNNFQVGSVSATGVVTFDTAVSATGTGGISVAYNHANYSRGYVQLGNGGHDADPTGAAAGTPNQQGDIKVASTGGNITFTAGLGDANYAQLGNGGFSTSGDHSGAIIARAAGDVIFSAGTAATTATGTLASRVNNYAQLGHGGNSALGNHSGNITVSSGTNGSFADVSAAPLTFTDTPPGAVTFTGGTSTDNYVQLGHGGRLARGDHGLTDLAGNALETIRVDAAGDIIFNGNSGARSYAQLGHGGHDADSTIDPRGAAANIAATSTGGDILFETRQAGSGDSAYVQLGHGGYTTRGSHRGTINVTADQNITINAAPSGTGANAYAQIGHGGRNAEGNHSGDITAVAGLGGTSGGLQVRSGGGAADRYAQLGHGGRLARGNHEGNVGVTSLDTILFQGGTSTRNYVQLGHGGHEAGLVGAAPGDAGNRGDIRVESTAGALEFRFAGTTTSPGADAYIQLGHGGNLTAGDHEGSIEALAETNLLFRNTSSTGTGSDTYVQLGHGGLEASGNFSGDITAMANTGTTQFRSGTSTNTATTAGQNRYARLGHGGTNATGSFSGDIRLLSEGTITFSNIGSAATIGSYTQLGHGGFNVTSALGHSGDITVQSHSGGLTFTGAANSTDSFSQLGHGGTNSIGSHFGNIAVQSATTTNFTGGTLAIRSYAQLGHGGHNADALAGEGHSGRIGVAAGTGLAFTAGSGTSQEAYSQLGHGGFDSDGNHGGERSVAGETGNTLNGIAFLGNGSVSPSTVAITLDPAGAAIAISDDGLGNLVDGGMNVVATIDYLTGRVEFNANVDGANAAVAANYAHGRGDIVARAGNTLIFTASTGTDTLIPDAVDPINNPATLVENRGYAQLGHGGYSAAGNLTGNITTGSQVTADFNDIGDFDGDGAADLVSITGGATGTNPFSFLAGSNATTEAASDVYAQLGHGGLLATGTRTGDIAVDAERTVRFQAGALGARGYAQLGHGGLDAAPVIDALNPVGLVNSGDISVISRTSAVNLLWVGTGTNTRDGTYVQLGHGGYLTDPLISGIDAGGSNRGDITVNAGTSLLLRSTTSAAASEGNYVQLGHGGIGWIGDHSGDITAVAGTTVTATAGAGVDRYALLGHGGTRAAGNHEGDIELLANGNITFAGTAASTRSYLQLGHGGYNADATVGNSGNIGVASRTGNITFTAPGGAATESYTQLGHGGYDAAGAHNGNVVLRAGNDITFQAGNGSGSLQGYAQLGHGGLKAVGSTDPVANLSGNLTVSAGTAGIFSDIGDFDNDLAFDSIDFLQGAGVNGLRFLAGTNGTAPGSVDAYAQLGHGGRLNRGAHDGDITVDSGSQILFQAGAIGARTYAQLGHGGHDSAVIGSGPGTTGNTGSITVNAASNLNFRRAATNTVTSSDTYLQLGHGGFTTDTAGVGGDNRGDIEVTANNVLFRGTTGATSTGNFVQLGHGGLRWSGNHSGNITVNATGTESASNRSIAFLGSGNAVDRYIQLGHGGRLARGNHGLVDGAGNAIETIAVTALGDIVFTAGSGTRGYAQLGNGGHDADLTTGARGAAANIDVLSQTGSVLFTGNSGDSAYAQLGNGGYATSGSHRGDLTVTADQSVQFLTSRVGTAANAYALLGNGGRDAAGNHAGDIFVTAENGEITFAGGSSNDRFAQLGHGGRGARGDHSGSINVDAETGITFSSFDGGPLLSTASGTATAVLNTLLLNDAAANFTLNQTANIDQTTLAITYANPLPGFSGRIIGLGGGVLVDETSLVQVGTMSNAGVINLSVTVSDPVAAAPAAVVTFEHTNLGLRSYAQLGHGGYDADFPTALTPGDPGNSGDIAVVSQSGAIQFTGGSRDVNYAQLGHGGFATNGAHSANVSVKALATDSDVLFLGGSRNDTYAQLGHGGRNAIGDHGLVGEVISVTANDIAFTGGSGLRSYAQFGNGGSAVNGNHAGEIQLHATNNLTVSSGTGGTEAYGLVGHGGIAAAAFTPANLVTNTTAGTRNGSILAEVGGVTRFVDLTSIGFMGHLGTTVPVSGSRLALLSGQIDTSTTIGGLSRLVSHALRSGSAEIGVTNGNLTFTGANSAVTSAHHLDLVASGDVIFDASVMNGGTGSINVVSGWDSTSGIVRDFDRDRTRLYNELAIDADAILADPAAYGNGGTVTVGDGTQSASRVIGSAQGTITVAGAGVSVQGSHSAANGFAQIGFNEEAFRLAGGTDGISATGNIRIFTSDGDLSLTGGDADEATARVGHGGQNTSSTTMSGDLNIALGSGVLNLEGGAGESSVAMLGHGGIRSHSQKSGSIEIMASEVNLTGGTGAGASAKLGHGGLRGSGAITGDLDLTVTGDVTLLGGADQSATSQIGFGGDAYDGAVTQSNLTINAGQNLTLTGGSGFASAASVGHGAFNRPNDDLSGDIRVDAGGDIFIAGGSNDYAFAQIGSGGGVSADISGDLTVNAGNNIVMEALNGGPGAYSKIGHGDDYTGSLSVISGSGSRSGDILLTAGSSISLSDAMIGHINSGSLATAAPAETVIATSRNNPTNPAAGSLIADSSSEFAGSTFVQVYTPERANNQIAAGALINGLSYAGTPVDPTVARLANEFTVFVTGDIIASPNEHTNVPGSGPLPVPGGFAFYYNTIALTVAGNALPEPEIIPGGGNSGLGPDDSDPINELIESLSARDDEFRRTVRLSLDDELIHEQSTIRRRIRRSKPFSITYKGFSQYATNGASIFTYSFNNAPDIQLLTSPVVTPAIPQL